MMVAGARAVCVHLSIRVLMGSAKNASRSAMVSRVVTMDVVESVVPVQQEQNAQMAIASIA